MSSTANAPNRVVPLSAGGSDRLVHAERLRIARELHDVVAYSFAAIALHAGVAEHVMDDRPDQVGEALLSPGATRRLVEELTRPGSSSMAGPQSRLLPAGSPVECRRNREERRRMFLSRQARIEPGRPVEALDAPPEVRLIDLWDAWLFAEARASLALRDWNCAADADKSAAYAAYRAALDSEELAAVVLERLGFPLS